MFGNSEPVAWNKSKQGIAFYKLGYYTAKGYFPRGYDTTKKAVLADAKIVNAKVPKGDSSILIYQVNSLTNDMLKPRAVVCISQRNKNTGNEVEALLDTGAQFNFISVKLVVLLKLKTFDINTSVLFKNKNISSITICGAVAKAKCITATSVALMTIKHINKNMPSYEAEFIVGEFSEN